MEECGVCLEDINECNFEVLSCSHKLCNKCYPQLKTNKCPFCRQSFIKRQVFNITPKEIIFDHNEFISKRQSRRQNNRRFVQNRNSPKRRRITNNNPIQIFYFEGEINLQENIVQEPKTNKKKNKNRWYDSQNKQKINTI